MRSSRILFAVACLAMCALATSANAASILQYGQITNNDTGITETVSGGTTTLTGGPTAAGSSTVPISITSLANAPTPPNILAFETFTLTSTQAPVAIPGGGTQQGGFSGVLTIAPGPPPTGPTPAIGYLTATITNGILSVTGQTASFISNNTVFTTLNPAIIAQNGGATTLPGATSLSLNNLAVSAGGFTANQTGLFATTVPEPASLVSGSLAALAGLGCFGWRRFKASRV